MLKVVDIPSGCHGARDLLLASARQRLPRLKTHEPGKTELQPVLFTEHGLFQSGGSSGRPQAGGELASSPIPPIPELTLSALSTSQPSPSSLSITVNTGGLRREQKILISFLGKTEVWVYGGVLNKLWNADRAIVKPSCHLSTF